MHLEEDTTIMSCDDVYDTDLDCINDEEDLYNVVIAHSDEWVKYGLVQMYLSKHRDRLFDRLFNMYVFTADNLLSAIAEPVEHVDSYNADMFSHASRGAQNERQTFLLLHRDYVLYLSRIYKAVTGHYPSTIY